MKKRKQRKDGPASTLYLITQIGIGMMTPIALCTIAGYLLDRFFGFGSAGFVFLMFFGIAVGYRNVWMLVRKYTRDEKPEEPVVAHISEAEAEFRKWKAEKEQAEGRNTR